MRLTTKGRYAVLAMVDVAMHQSKGPVPLVEVAARQELSQSYLEQLFAKLRTEKLVVSTRGTRGGYRLARTPDEISVTQVIQAIHEPMDATRCHGAENCQNGQRCSVHFLWAGLNDVISNFLSTVTLAHLLSEEQATHIEERVQWFKPVGGQHVRCHLS